MGIGPGLCTPPWTGGERRDEPADAGPPKPPSHSRRCLIVVFVFVIVLVVLPTATCCSQKRRCHRNYTQPKETPTAQIRHPTLFNQALPSLVTRPPILTVRCSARGHAVRTGAMGAKEGRGRCVAGPRPAKNASRGPGPRRRPGPVRVANCRPATVRERARVAAAHSDYRMLPTPRLSRRPRSGGW